LLRDVLAYREQRWAEQYRALDDSAVDIDDEEDIEAVLASLREARHTVAVRRRRREVCRGASVSTALLRSSVLWPSLQRDILLSLTVEGLYRPIWSAAVLEELECHETARLERRGIAAEEAQTRTAHLLAQPRQAFDDAEIGGWEGLEGTYRLPVPDEEHVVAASRTAPSSPPASGTYCPLDSRQDPGSRCGRVRHQHGLARPGQEPGCRRPDRGAERPAQGGLAR